MKTTLQNWIKKHQLVSFFVLTYLITFVVDFLFIALAPGKPLQPWSLVWFLTIFSPSFSALIIAGIIGGLPEIKRLLTGLGRWKVGIR